MRNHFPFLLLAACQLAATAHTTTSPAASATGPATGPAPAAATTAPAHVFHLAMGADPSADPATCDASDNQCLPVECVFAVDDDSPDIAYVAWPTDDGPWTRAREDVIRGRPRILTTAPATRDNVHAGATVLVFGLGDRAPTSEGATVDGDWTVHQIASLDGDTIRFAGGGYASLVASRVVQ